jgi:hypothetical protein
MRQRSGDAGYGARNDYPLAATRAIETRAHDRVGIEPREPGYALNWVALLLKQFRPHRRRTERGDRYAVFGNLGVNRL